MIQKTRTALTVIVFLLTLIFPKVISAQLDSLRQKVYSNTIDTSGLKKLYDLGSNMVYQNPDTAIVISELTIKASLFKIENANKTGDTQTKDFCFTAIGISYNNIGIAYEFKADYSKSMWYHLQSLEIKTKMLDTLGIGMSYNNIGNVYDSQGEYIQALNYYIKSSHCFIDLKDIMRIATSYNNVGIEYYRIGEQNKALDYYFKALQLYAHIKNYANVAQIYTNIAISYFSLKDYNKSLEYNFKSLELEKGRENSNEYNIAIVYTNLSTLFLQLKNYKESEKYIKLALEINERLGLLYGVSTNLGELGTIYFETGNYAESQKYLEKSLKIAEEIQAMDLIKGRNQLLSQVYEKTGQFQKAFYSEKEYNRVNEIIFNSEKSKEMGRLEAVHEIKEAERIETEKKAFDERVKVDKRRRKNLLQYSSIVIILFLIALMVTLMGVVKVKPSVATAVSFFAFLLLFEFLLLLFDPTIDKYSQGEPALKLALNALVAVAIFPIHSFFDRLLRKRLTKQATPK